MRKGMSVRKDKTKKGKRFGYINAEELVGKCDKTYNERLIEMEVMARFICVGGL